MAVRRSDSSTGNNDWASSRVKVRSDIVGDTILPHPQVRARGFPRAAEWRLGRSDLQHPLPGEAQPGSKFLSGWLCRKRVSQKRAGGEFSASWHAMDR